MAKRRFRIGELAQLAGVSVRTLHHYDEIGLLVPGARSGADYRLYDEHDLLRLQQILIRRGLGFGLEAIRRALDDPEFDGHRALLEQREQLVARVKTAHAMIAAIDEALKAKRVGKQMDVKKIFDGFDPKDYETEAEQRWGDSESFKESARRTAGYRQEDWQRIKAERATIMTELAEAMERGLAPEDPGVRGLAEQYRQHIDRWFYPCPPEKLVLFSQAYVTDPRFQKNIDKTADGLASFLRRAIVAAHDSP